MSASTSTGAAEAVMATADELPILPAITPALCVAGVLLILTGITYCFVGIKRNWIQISISTAYLVALAITALIIYIEDPPVSLALQGAYLVAIAAPALVLAPLAYIFKDVTEGFGCAVGGFAMSMFLLVQRPSGLLPTTAQKAIFISCWTIGVYLFAFSRFTRTWALIASTSIGGATAVVLGIDCFSQAGLKEFWVYIWGLNSLIFPPSTQSYPITRAMRVEIAAIVVLSFFGILSQVRIWRIVRKQKEDKKKRDQDIERQRDDIEAEIGRQIESTAAEGREQWEALYGDPNKNSSEAIVAEVHPESDLGTEANSSRKHSEVETAEAGEHVKTVTVCTTSLEGVAETSLEMTLMEPAELSADSEAETAPMIDSKWPFSSINSIDGAGRMSQESSRRISTASRKSISRQKPLAEQVPLIETHAELELNTVDGTMKSISIVHESLPISVPSFDKTVASGTSKLNRHSTYTMTSIEALADPTFYDDCFSMGGLDFVDHYVGPSGKEEYDIQKDESVKSTVELDDSDGSLLVDTALTEQSERVQSVSLGNEQEDNMPSKDFTQSVEAAIAEHLQLQDPEEINNAPTSEKGSQLRSKTSLQSLKEEHPEKASPIVQRFRTNEWAKHLSLAEEPELDPIQPGDSDETPCPLDTDALVQTPLTAEPEPQVPLKSSTTSTSSLVQYTPGGRPIPSFQHGSYGPPVTVPSGSRHGNESEPRFQDLRRASAPSLPRQSSRRGASGLRSGMSPLLRSTISEDKEMFFHTPIASPQPMPTLIAERNKMLQYRDMTGQTRLGPILHPSSSSSSLSFRQNSTHSLRSTSTNSQSDIDETQPLSTRRQQLKLQKRQNRASMPSGPARVPPRSLTYPPQPNSFANNPMPTLYTSYTAPPSDRIAQDQSLRRRTMLAHWHSSLSAERSGALTPWTAQDPNSPPAPAPAPAPQTGLHPLDRKQPPTWRDRQTRGGKAGWGSPGEAEHLAALGGAHKLNDAHREVLRRMQAGANARLKVDDS